ncbi:hypothetical protein BS643_17855 [Pseudomonas protegens]|nr:hypothetical protein BBH58_16980 [Pseudomonas protegens]OBZ26778.1 hypothetical protein BBH57_23855 [Pseudomonas protegens]OKK41273.1 hypothetical protein BS643_17855 [Pseudomonas protegens]OKK43346.1 hypothetical protein BS644_22625 [Pseudomonas protegens]OKK55370.1 hypothetical protein BS646_29575 [Pseudomonas protegens]
MISMFRTLLSGLCLLSVASIAHGQQATAPEQLLSDFSRCDAQFFQNLNTARLPTGTLSLARYGAVSAPKVMNPLQEGGRYQTFEQPLLVNGVRLVGYYNEAQSLKSVGNLLFWGFVAEGQPKDVAAALKPLLVDNSRLKADRSAMSRVEIRRVGDPIDQWRTEGLAGGGVATPFGYVERILSIDIGTTHAPIAGRTTIFCSLQGTVTAPLLQVYRPDLNAHLLD